MNCARSACTAALAAFWLASTSYAAQQARDTSDAASVREALHDLAERIDAARASGERADELAAQYAQLRAALGGDDQANANFGAATPATNSNSPQFVFSPPCGGATPTTSIYVGSGGAIFNGSFATYTCNIAGLGSYLWDVNLTTFITHTANFDLDIQLISPSGTAVTITTDNGLMHDNVFNGTLWDDNVNVLVTDYTFTNLVTATPLSPEGRLSAFRGENPNGVWTLRVQDDSIGNVGAVNAWSLDVSALATAPTGTTTTTVRTPGIAIPDAATTSDAMTVSGAGAYLAKVELYVEIPHTSPTDLDMRLISPAGTSVWVATDCGGSFDDVFNGTRWDPSSTLTPTDYVYANGVVVPVLAPEGSFDNFLGQNPNGVWTLQITDDAAGEVGSLVRWELRITTIPNPGSPAPINSAGTTGPIPDAGSAPPTLFTTTVAGMSGVVWDVDVTTAIAHLLCADIDMTLISPAGTTVTLTTDNGFTQNVFNGTLWDDNVNDPVTDHAFTGNVTATPLSPEGRLAAFRGEAPNGVWTLSITDDSLAVAGTLNSWSMGLTTIPNLPSVSTTTATSSPNLVVLDNTTVTDTITLAGLPGPVYSVKVYVEIPHMWSDDLDVTLTSPAGTVVTLSTDNGGSFDDVFNGTTFDVDAPQPVSDYPYVDLMPAPMVSPEGSFDLFFGQNPNGVWTLSVTDDFSPDTGTFVRWDLTVSVCGVSVPTSYCPPTAPGTSNGCLPTISANSNPNVAHTQPCLIGIAGTEGQKSGIVFYGITGTTALPWCPGANTFLCVKLPTQRTVPQSTGGVSGQCSGSLALDWNAFQLASPTALGNPWLAGAKAYVQGWFRDPPSCKTTFLSEALELTYQP